jgi:hypothetical protein
VVDVEIDPINGMHDACSLAPQDTALHDVKMLD